MWGRAEDAATVDHFGQRMAVNHPVAADHRFLLSHLVPRSTELYPDAVAVACDHEQLTWEELDRRVGRLASALTRAGVGSGDRVGIYLHKSIESVVAVHGVLRAGAAYVPIDPVAPVETIAAIIADCGIEILVTHELRRAGVVRLAPLVALRTIIGLDPETAGQSAPVATPACPPPTNREMVATTRRSTPGSGGGSWRPASRCTPSPTSTGRSRTFR